MAPAPTGNMAKFTWKGQPALKIHSQIKHLRRVINYTDGQIREKTKSTAQKFMTLKLICLWIFSQNADICDYINLKQVPHLRHITTNNPNLPVQSKPTILVDFLYKGKHPKNSVCWERSSKEFGMQFGICAAEASILECNLESSI